MMSPKSTQKTSFVGFSSDPALQAIITTPPSSAPIALPLSDMALEVSGYPAPSNHYAVSSPPASCELPVGKAPSHMNGHAQARDDDLFQKVFIEYSRPLHRYVSNLKMSLNYDDTWDIVQKTFIEASRLWDTLKTYNEEHRRKWLYRVARNKAHDYFRHLKARSQLWEKCCEEHGTGKPQEKQVIEDHEKVKRVHQALKELSDRELECLLLALEEFKLKEIAEMLNIKENSVSSHLSRGRQKFRQAYLRLVNPSDKTERRS